MERLVEAMIERWFTARCRAAHPDEVELTRATVRANAQRDWTDALDAIRCPVLFIGGADDPGDARRSATTFAEHLPQLEAHILENASHLLPVEQPTITNDLLLRFLSSSGGGASTPTSSCASDRSRSATWHAVATT
jgi:pimeloyl-ACP methyl ester carboxylesterase